MPTVLTHGTFEDVLGAAGVCDKLRSAWAASGTADGNTRGASGKELPAELVPVPGGAAFELEPKSVPFLGLGSW